MRRRKRSCPSCKRLEKDLQLLKDMVARLIQENQRLKEENEDLKEKLNRDSSNSSMPPSSDPPEKAPKPSKPKSPRKRGAQPGHKDQQREPYPPEQVDSFVPCKPGVCEQCGVPLDGEDPQPRCEQKVDLPPIQPIVTEYQVHTLECKGCGHMTTGALPDGVQNGVFSPQIQAMVSLFSGAFRLSKREIARIMEDVFNVKMSLGSVSNLERATSKALEAPVEEAKEYVKNQSVAFADETGWRENKKKAWLWTAVTAQVVVFLIRLSRGAVVAKELLGEAFQGILHSDRWSGYNWIPLKFRQICWAHLARDFKKVADRGGASARIGNALLDWAAEMFSLWDRVRNGKLKRSSFRTYMTRIRQEIHTLLEEGAVCRNQKTARFCKNLLAMEPALWTFVRVEGVEPTNNAAERQIRKPVLWRKGSFGTDSSNGSQFVERILTTVATLRAQGRNVMKYLAEACKAAILKRPAPSLLPSSIRTP